MFPDVIGVLKRHPQSMLKSVDTDGSVQCIVGSTTFACRNRPHTGEILMKSRRKFYVSLNQAIVPVAIAYRKHAGTSEILSLKTLRHFHLFNKP
jgi:hypothetical protein